MAGRCRLFFVDEATFHLDCPVRRCWMPRGQQRTFPAYTGSQSPAHLIGALDWLTDQVFSHTVSRKQGDTFIEFLETLCLSLFPDEPLVLVMDNVSYHRSAPVLAFLALLQPRVQVIWLPKYSPDMNPIERFWLHLKNQVYANRLFRSASHLTQHIHLWLSIQNSPNHPDRLSFAKHFR